MKCLIFLLSLKWENDWIFIELITTGVIVFWAFALSFLACEIGQWVTNQYNVLGDELTAINWYSLPIELQRTYLVFLLDTQQPIHIESYGGIVSSRETFKKVGGFLSQYEIIKQMKANVHSVLSIDCYLHCRLLYFFIVRLPTKDFRIL